MKKFEYDGNDILSIKMALENMLESRKKYNIDNEKELNNDIINLNTSSDVVYYVCNMIDDYC